MKTLITKILAITKTWDDHEAGRRCEAHFKYPATAGGYFALSSEHLATSNALNTSND